MKRVYLYFGSFNPPHIGHLAIAHYLITERESDELWFVVSPHNPLKSRDELAAVEDRLEMMKLAANGLGNRVKVCDIELSMPQPSYTYDTLKRLKELHPEVKFTIVMGEDNYSQIGKWYRCQDIIEEFAISVYPRTGVELNAHIPSGDIEQLLDVPTFNISSSLLRKYIKKGVDISIFTPKEVVDYITNRGVYADK